MDVSLKGRLYKILFKVINKKKLLKKQFDYGLFNFFSSDGPPPKMWSSYIVEDSSIDGHKIFTIKPKTGNSRKHILYLHGGAYVQSFLRPHWKFLDLLVKETNCTITAPDYPLAPAYTYKESFAMVSELYKRIIQYVNPSDLILMGDSAGGGFALALAQFMKNENVAQPAQLILLSPWLDLSLKNPEIAALDSCDYFLGIEGLKLAGKAYAGNTDTDHYLLSPINGPLEGLGEIYLLMGTREILVADSRRFKEMADEAGIKINYYEYPGMFHAWMFFNLPEAKKARDQIIGFVNNS